MLPSSRYWDPVVMKLAAPFISLALCAASAQAGTVIWSGLFNSSFTTSMFDQWSWSNQIAPWQWYIHGSSATSNYLAVSSSYKNPADTSDAQGIRMTIDGTSFWNGQTMERTEIIPQTSANLGTGHLFYHFSLMTSSTHPPAATNEHQIAFFESHFTEIKYGLISGESGTSDNALRWDIGGQTQWSTPLVAGTWYNFAYDIDFSAGKCGLWQSTGSSALTQVVAPMSCSPSTNSADWHIGMLRLPNGGTSTAPEDFFWSGIFIESGSITTSIAGPQPGSGGSSPPVTTTTGKPTTTTTKPGTTTTPVQTTTTPATTPVSTTTTASGATQTKYGQCGGTGWTGPTVCAAGSTCTAVSPPYYSQCL